MCECCCGGWIEEEPVDKERREEEQGDASTKAPGDREGRAEPAASRKGTAGR